MRGSTAETQRISELPGMPPKTRLSNLIEERFAMKQELDKARIAIKNIDEKIRSEVNVHEPRLVDWNGNTYKVSVDLSGPRVTIKHVPKKPTARGM